MSLRNETQTDHSITLRWEAPPDPHSRLYTYQVQWARGKQAQKQGQTTETSYRVEGLEPGTPYSLRVWAERNEVAGSQVTLPANTGEGDFQGCAPWTTSPVMPCASLPLCSEVEGARGLMGVVVSELVLELTGFWSGRNGGSCSDRALGLAGDPAPLCGPDPSGAPAAPAPVAVASCSSAWGGSGLTLRWACPPGGYEAFLLELSGRLRLENRSACGSPVPVGGLQPARAYEARVSTVWAGLVAPGASATCRTSSAGERPGLAGNPGDPRRSSWLSDGYCWVSGVLPLGWMWGHSPSIARGSSCLFLGAPVDIWDPS